tara:strand:- start:814 stop:1326 length:513 start_codon:yes stop_codon:yes gene_type:complete
MSVVYTIGYESTDIERFIDTLKAVGVKRLADVRALALSRKKGFSKKALSARLEAEGIEYLHFVQLGDPKPGREAAKAGLYAEFREIYEAHLNSEEAQSSLKELIFAAQEKPTCLLCFEHSPETCHRSIVAEEISGSGLEVLNLYGNNPKRYVRNASRMPRYHPRESTASA